MRRGIIAAAGSAVPPVPVSQTILSDGVTLRLVFDKALTIGDEVGLSRSVGTITSASVVGGNLDVVIPRVYEGDEVGTITYDGTGTLAGDDGAVAAFGPLAITNNAAAWTPALLTGIIDYGVWDDATRLNQLSDGTGDPADSPGDPVGRWMGQLDVMSYGQAAAGSRPTLAANGVEWDGLGVANKSMDSTTQFALNNSFTLAAGWATTSATQGMFAVRLFGTSSEWVVARDSGSGNVRVSHRGASTVTGTSITDGVYILTGTATVPKAWKNGVEMKTVTTGADLSAGTGTATSTINRIQGNQTASASMVSVAWVVCAGAGADIDATEEARLRAWFVAQGAAA